ncbi:hypothetical protein RBU49_04245 [Clostridium sp. MB40-C1]|uniref:hypothetical protein n=1 Tax=Clostridium sp. MB40-C1 TaxID=3070996 RepID=UPI0027E211A3|nr:hypothetical protein [Clostridium sp. MB40-C1]WMJ81472.1 hypothetical protein RBU49_04245 [Clostridium sp. MB40-C1]
MNDINRKETRDILKRLYGINSTIKEFDFSVLEDITGALIDVKEDEEWKFDNLNESLQQTENALKMQSSGECLEESISELEEFDYELFNINIENLINNLEGLNKI